MFPNLTARGGIVEFSKHQEEERVIQFLLDLNESFVNIKGQILSIDKLPNLARVYAIFYKEEKQKGTSKRKTHESAAYQVSLENARKNLYKQGKKEKISVTIMEAIGYI